MALSTCLVGDTELSTSIEIIIALDEYFDSIFIQFQSLDF